MSATAKSRLYSKSILLAGVAPCALAAAVAVSGAGRHQPGPREALRQHGDRGHRHRSEAEPTPPGRADRRHRAEPAEAAGRPGQVGQRPDPADPGPQRHHQRQRVDHDRAHPRRRQRVRQSRPRRRGRPLHRRRLSPAQRRRLQRSRRAVRHRNPQGSARHPVRQEHHRRRDPGHHGAPVVQLRLPGRGHGAELRRLWRIAVGHRPDHRGHAGGPALPRRPRARRLRARGAEARTGPTSRPRTTSTSTPRAANCCSRRRRCSTST